MKKKTASLLLSLILVLPLLFLQVPTYPAKADMYTSSSPTKDSFVSEGNPAINYGSLDYMIVQSFSGANARGLVEFNISSIPSEATIISATLKLYRDGALVGHDPAGRTYRIHRINGSWTESGVTWNNQPSVATGYVEAATPNVNSWWTVDVASITVLGTTIGYRIMDANEDSGINYGLHFETKEGAHAPILEIVYSRAPSVSLVSPADSYTAAGTVMFDWNFTDPDSNDSQSAYAFQLSRNISFTDLVININKTSSTVTNVNITLPSQEGTYYWRVKVWDNHDLSSGWSSNRSIIVSITSSYDIYAAYYEDDGSFQGNSSVTVVHINGEETTYTVHQNQSFNFSDQILCFRWNITDGNERVIYVVDTYENLTLFIPEGTYSIYYFTIQDYIGLLQTGDAYLESYRFVNGSVQQSKLIERKLVQDYVSEVPLIMNVGSTYLLKLRVGSTVYSFGYFTAGSDTTQTLPVQDISFTSRVEIAYRYVRVEASRNNTEITVNYQDTLENTTSVSLEIQYRNGSVAYSDSSTGYLVQFYWGNADSETDYIVYVTVNHASLGTLNYKQVLPYSPSVSPPFDLSPLGTFPITNNQVVPLVIILFVAGVFSTLTAPLGIFLTVLTAVVLRYIGWLNLSWTILSFAMSLAVIYAIAVLKRRMR